MTEAMNSVNAEQGAVVEQPTGAADANTNPAGAQQATGESGVANQSQKQTREANQTFAAMRKRAEEAERKLAQHQADADRLSNLVNQQYGFTGGLNEVSDQLEAAATGRSIEEIRAERQAIAQRDEQIMNLQNQVNQMTPLVIANIKADLLQKVKEAYPDCTATSVDEFGDGFAALVNNGVPPDLAYANYMSNKAATQKPIPPAPGKVNTSNQPEPDYYTNDQVKKMSKAEIRKNLDKIMASMGKW